MSVNAIEPADAQPVAQTQNSELIYRLEDRPPLPQTLFAACQHLLAMFVAVITPALLICQALGLPAQDTQHIISMSLVRLRRSLYYSNQSVGAGRIGAVIHPGNQF